MYYSDSSLEQSEVKFMQMSSDSLKRKQQNSSVEFEEQIMNENRSKRLN